jgi:hypothetical protein
MTQSDGDAVFPDGRELDDQILRLRESGDSFLAIAEQLGLDRATVARSGYLRALARLSPEEQRASRLSELQRLDALANHIAACDDLDGPEITRRLRLVDLLRLDLPEQ